MSDISADYITARDEQVADALRHQVYHGGSSFVDIVASYRLELVNPLNRRIERLLNEKRQLQEQLTVYENQGAGI